METVTGTVTGKALRSASACRVCASRVDVAPGMTGGADKEATTDTLSEPASSLVSEAMRSTKVRSSAST